MNNPATCPRCGRPLPADAVGELCPACVLEAALNLTPAPAPRASAQRPALRRKRLKHYQLIEKIGEGGMGVVYKARDTRLDRLVAIKILPADKVSDPERRRRFIHEAKAASALNHPNIVTIYEVAAASGMHFIAMEFVAGRTLDQLVGSHGLPPEQVLLYAVPIAGALARAHEAGIVHRDLKPQNIMVRDDGLVKLLDFGLAKLVEVTEAQHGHVVDPAAPAAGYTQDVAPRGSAGTSGDTFLTEPSRIMGTPGFMAPEQIEGRKVDGRADIFAFGAVLYHALSGRKPFGRSTVDETFQAILHGEPAALENVSAGLTAIVTRCLRKDPGERFPNAAELQAALRNITTAAAEEKPEPSVAVLPFANLGGKPEDGYLGDALSGEIISALARVPGLKVAGRTSSLLVANARLDPREIGKRLGVAHVLEGSVQPAAETLHVAARLLRAGDGGCVWADSFDRASNELFAIQRAIADAVAAQIGVATHARAPRPRSPTDSTEAYHHYLVGRHAFDCSDFNTARQQFERATRLDPAFALAYDALAEVWWHLGFWGATTQKNAVTQGVWAALRALEIDDQLADTHALLAQFRWVSDFNLEATQAEFRRARELDPESPKVRFRYAITGLLPHGRLAETRAEFEAILTTDPLSVQTHGWLAVTLQMQRDYEASVARCQFALDHGLHAPTNHLVMGLSLEWLGRRAEAFSTLYAFADQTSRSSHALGLLGWLHGRAGEIEPARALLAEITERNRREYVPPSAHAWVFIGLGDIDSAVDWIDRGIDVADPMVVALKPWPIYDPVRDHPRYPALLQRMNIEP